MSEPNSDDLVLMALRGIPMVKAGDDLGAVILSALRASRLRLAAGDILVVAQKVVSKAEGRMVDLRTVTPSARAVTLAKATEKDPRIVELILAESTDVLRHRPGALIVAHRLGMVLANAGIDQSNVGEEECALLLPLDPDRTCAAIRRKLADAAGVDVGVMIIDSIGRAWRNGTIGTAIGLSGLPGLLDLRAARRLGAGTYPPAREGSVSMTEASARGDATSERPSADAFHRLMRSRRSIRTYRPGAVGADLLERLFASAAAAPSAHNRQPWRYVVIDEMEAKQALARAMGERLADDRRRDGDAEDAIARDVARSFARITGAPMPILVCVTLEHADTYLDAARSQAEFLMAVQSAAMATQNLLLGAHAEGLAACWMCAPLFCPDVVRSALAFPPHWQPQGLITLGWPADGGRERPRRPVDEFVAWAGVVSSPSSRSRGERVGVRGLSASPDRVEGPLIPTFDPQAGRRGSEAARNQTVVRQVAEDGGELFGHPGSA